LGFPPPQRISRALTHAPDIVLIYESGPIGAKPPVLPLSIGDGNLAETADTVVSTPEIFRYWLQGGRVDVGFLGAAQIDRFANINTTVIGDYKRPATRLPGAGGAPEIASCASEVVLLLKQSARAFVKNSTSSPPSVISMAATRANGLAFPARVPSRLSLIFV
jgi:glutaconate CoA-transferase subunit B